MEIQTQHHHVCHITLFKQPLPASSDTASASVTDIAFPPYPPWGMGRLWDIGGLGVFGSVDI